MYLVKEVTPLVNPPAFPDAPVKSRAHPCPGSHFREGQNGKASTLM